MHIAIRRPPDAWVTPTRKHSQLNTLAQALQYNAPEAHIALLLWLREPRALPITVTVPHALHFFELLVVYCVPVLEGSRVRTELSTAASAYRVAVLVKSLVRVILGPDVRLICLNPVQ